MRHLGLCVLLVMVLTGCVNRWEHPTKRPVEFQADDRECQQITGGAAQPVEPGSLRPSYESCMWERGWRKKNTIWFFDPTDK